MLPMDRRIFHMLRGPGEALLRRLYGSWAVRFARQFGLQPEPTLVRVQLTLPAPDPCPPLRVAFASDFHAGPTTHPTVIRSACQLLRNVRPDVLLLGGDFVSLHMRALPDLIAQLRTIPTTYGTYLVRGNHDYWENHHSLIRQFTETGCALLTNRNVRLPPPLAHVWLCGLDDSDEGRPDAASAFAGADGTRVVLMHSPEGLAGIGDQRFDLALCGHTHGGQVCLPGGRLLHVPPGSYTRCYAAGQYRVRTGTLVVSRGVGCSSAPIRWGAPPDVVVCDLIWTRTTGSTESDITGQLSAVTVSR